MNTSIRLLLVVLLIVAAVGNETLGANFEVPSADGWYSWQSEAADGSELQLFALVESGRPVRLLARGNAICFSGYPTDAVDLGSVAADQSINWLRGHIYPVSGLSSEAILLISLHGGDLPMGILERLLAIAD